MIRPADIPVTVDPELPPGVFQVRAGDQVATMQNGQVLGPGRIPGWEGSIGPFRSEYHLPHVYARDIQSGAGNCVCGRHLGHRVHVQAAPGVPIPDHLRS